MNEEKRPPRISVSLSQGSSEQLERYAKLVQKDKVATVAAYLLQEKLDELEASGKIPEALISKDDFEQVVKFVKLLLGEYERNGISFALLGDLLGVEPSKLNDLHNFLEECRKNHKHSEV